jgi:hypothetical protein
MTLGPSDNFSANGGNGVTGTSGGNGQPVNSGQNGQSNGGVELGGNGGKGGSGGNGGFGGSGGGGSGGTIFISASLLSGMDQASLSASGGSGAGAGRILLAANNAFSSPTLSHGEGLGTFTGERATNSFLTSAAATPYLPDTVGEGEEQRRKGAMLIDQQGVTVDQNMAWQHSARGDMWIGDNCRAIPG